MEKEIRDCRYKANINHKIYTHDSAPCPINQKIQIEMS